MTHNEAAKRDCQARCNEAASGTIWAARGGVVGRDLASGLAELRRLASRLVSRDARNRGVHRSGRGAHEVVEGGGLQPQ
eukprot:NODE_7456_length_439_cov_81.799479.p3 GENE.NODE_7456_length_439_cov_81.799479~~NODE_7456_length_439_cov_81.799479.p3  ORF type:complete len:79 (-),score=13.33 NODE_7456_length_439_cov_81.799479:109-345(-)